MGDRFYMQQRAAMGKGGKNGPAKQPRKLKKDIIADLCTYLGTKIDGLDKMTIPTLEALYNAIKVKDSEW